MTAPYALELRGIVKRFGETVANRGAELRVRAGEIHALVGENGAGKSTLMRIAAGLVRPDAGEVLVRGRRLEPHSPAGAIAAGIGMVHQHFMLVPGLTVAENVVLGREPRRGLAFDRARAEREVRALSERHHLPVDPRRRIEDLSVGEEQRVEILKVLYRDADLLILDEPTAVLAPAEVEALFRTIRALVETGRTVVLITHKLDEVMAVSQRVTVLGRGQTVAELETARATAADIARAMIGRDLAPVRAGTPPRAGGPPALELRGVSVRRRGVRRLEDVSLSIAPGEILGIAGVEGNGQSELVDAVVGLAPLDRGSVLLSGRDVSRASVSDRFRLGLGYVPEDRLRGGLVAELSVADNLLLGRLHRFARWGGAGPIDRRALDAHATALALRYDIRPADPEAPVRTLSGGNQQKVVLARALGADLAVLVAAHPTRGVDVGAVERIQREILAARERGVAVLLVSADLDELCAIADRIAVLYRGKVAGVLDARRNGPAEIGALMTGAWEGPA